MFRRARPVGGQRCAGECFGDSPRNPRADTAFIALMYRTDLNNRDRTGAIAAVLAIHAGLLFLLLTLSGRIELPDPQEALDVIDIIDPPQPPPPATPSKASKPKEKEGGSSPKNIKSEATPVVAPKPRVEPLIPNPVVAAETPRQGTAPTQGAASVAGPGTGSGGFGTGTGSGVGGGGPGGGGGGGAVMRTRLVSPPLGGRDFPQELLRQWPRGRPLFARFRIAPNGAILACVIDRGTGVPAIDANFCALAARRLRFRPGLDRQGRPVADWAAYGQQPPR